MQDFSEKKVKNSTLSHINAAGEAQMVDVSEKNITKREAIATGRVLMSQACSEAIQAGDAPKGDVLGTARIAGIMAAKQTSNLIPMCHPLPIKKVNVTFTPDETASGYIVEASVTTKSETGVEMEALTAVSVAALTLYDMAKALDKAMTITDVQLQKKTGGKSGDYLRKSL